MRLRPGLAALALAIAIAGCAPPPKDGVTAKPVAGRRTFGDAMTPMSTRPWSPADLTVTSGTKPPAWDDVQHIRWDTPGAFIHSQLPRPIGSVSSAATHTPSRPDDGAEYPFLNASLKNADVTFTITSRRFAIAYRGSQNVDAMLWVDSRPVAARPIFGAGPTGVPTPNWITVTLPKRKTVTVRFAGPLAFTGVDVPAAEQPVLKATKPAVTLGVLSDSYYELCPQVGCMSRNAAPMLATLTGFRVWNMSEAGTGYLNPGRGILPGFEPSVYGSPQRLKAVEQAPIDALLIGGSINDAAVPMGDYRATVDRLLNELEESRPDLPVVLLGIEPLGGEFRGWSWRMRGATMTRILRSMVSRHRNVVGFIDPFTRPWLTGSGSIVRPTGDGNDDRYIGEDGIHPSVAGTRYYQRRVADALRRIPFPKATAATSPAS